MGRGSMTPNAEQTANEPLTIVYNGKAVTVELCPGRPVQDVADFLTACGRNRIRRHARLRLGRAGSR